MSLSFALAYPDLIHGAAVLTGTLLEEAKPYATENRAGLAGKPIFIGYGTLDSLISPADMEEAQRFLEPFEVAVTLKAYRIPHVVNAAERRDVETWINLTDLSELG